MNDNTTRLLESLAAKLGTTADHLWRVLLNQAPISSAVNLIVMLATTALLLAALYGCVKFTLMYCKHGEGDGFGIAATVLGILAAFFLICVICYWSQADTLLSGFWNPEFWALDYIVSHVK